MTTETTETTETTATKRTLKAADVRRLADAYLLTDDLRSHHLSAVWLYERYERATEAQAARVAYEQATGESDALLRELDEALGSHNAWHAIQRRRGYWRQRAEERQAQRQRERRAAEAAHAAAILAKPLPVPPERVRLWPESTVGCYYHDADGAGWSTFSGPPVACALCGATITGGYHRGIGDLLICVEHVEHVAEAADASEPEPSDAA